MHKNYTQKGFSTVEALVAAGVLVVIVVVVAGVLQSFARLSAQTAHTSKAALLLEEGVEALQIMRDQDWADISSTTLDTPYSFFWNGSEYMFSATTTLIDNTYNREVVFSAVNRDGSGLFNEGGDLDDNSRYATFTIYLNSDGSVLGSTETLIHNAYE